MNPLLQVPGQAPGKFRMGQRVRFTTIYKGTIGEVVEDRGNLGVGGQRIYAVKVRLDPWNEPTIELPEESFEAVVDGPNSTPQAEGKESKSGKTGNR